MIGAFAQIVLFEPLTRRIGELNIIRAAIIYTAVLVFVITFLDSYWSVMAVAFIIFIGFDLVRPAVTTFLSHIAGNNQGFAGGMNSFFTSLANVIGPVLAGILFDIIWTSLITQCGHSLDWIYYYRVFLRDPRKV